MMSLKTTFALLICFAWSTSVLAQPAEVGDRQVQRPEQASSARGFDQRELARQRSALKEYFGQRRSRLQIEATTVTDSGQVIDWIRPGSQVSEKTLAAPPPFSDEDKDKGSSTDLPVPFELVSQAHARGPAGTVPVLRRTDELAEKIAPGTIDDFLSKYGRADDIVDPEFAVPGASEHDYAYSAQYVENFGGHGNINVWNPYVYKSTEFSLGQVAVVRENGGSAKQTIEAGWQDYRNLYGDYYPHFFIYYTTNGYSSQGDNVGGYNRDVDGWVQYSSTVFPGARITWGSTYNGSQYSMHVRVQLFNGNWWIKMNNEWVGYYPASLFASNGLRYKADKISWYGEIVDVDDSIKTYTDMGSGRHASQRWQKAAYMRNIWVYYASNGYRYQYNPGSIWATDSGCYSIEKHFQSGGSWESYFWWGGPGKNSACP